MISARKNRSTDRCDALHSTEPMIVIACLISRNNILERLSRVLFVGPKCLCYIQTRGMRGTKRVVF
jgi:hypothetical protein